MEGRRGGKRYSTERKERQKNVKPETTPSSPETPESKAQSEVCREKHLLDCCLNYSDFFI